MASSPSVLQVFVFRGEAYVGSEVFTEPEIVIGNSDSVTLYVDDQSIGSEHAVLSHKNGQATLLDLGHPGGTRVNRSPVQQSFVTARDEIQIGSHTLKIKFMGGAGASRRPSRDFEAAGSPGGARSPGGSSAPEPTIQGSLTGATPLAHATEVEPRTEVMNVRHQAMSARTSAPPRRRPPATSPRGNGGYGGSDYISGHELIDEGAIPAGFYTAPDHISDDIAEGPDAIEAALDSAFDVGPPREEPRRPRRTPALGSPRTVAPASAPAPTSPAGVSTTTTASPGGGLAARSQPLAAAIATAPTPASARPPQGHPNPAAGLGDDLNLQRAHAHAHAFQNAEEDGEDEDLDDDMRPPFALLEALLSPVRSTAGEDPSEPLALEIIGFAGNDVQSAAMLKEKGETFTIGSEGPGAKGGGADASGSTHKGLRLASMIEPGRAQIQFPASAHGGLERDRQRTNLDHLKVPGNAVAKTGALFQTLVEAGTSATIDLGGYGYVVRFVRPPKARIEGHASGAGKQKLIDAFTRNAFLASLGFHFLFFVVLGLSSSGVTYTDIAREEWAEAQQEIRDVEVEPEPPPEVVPEPEPEPEPTPEPEPEPERQRPEPRKPPKRSKVRQQRGPAKGYTQEEVRGAGVLGAMGKLNLKAPGKASIMQKVSNIDAVRAPGGSNFRVGALVGKMPSSDVSLGAGGGGGPLTRGAASLIKGGKGFAQIGKRHGAQVRGRVTRASATRLKAQGSISREEVARVINQHLREVQSCYEKTLISDPGLSGKLVLEWTIQENGSVGRVKQKTSTLRNPGVASCIMSALKRWNFPKPRGGVVIVSYPFIFSSVGF